MNNNDVLFQALGSIGAMPIYYVYTDTVTPFVNSIWTDNTIKQQPTDQIKRLILQLFESISISSTCVYGIPKEAQYPRYICPAASSASAYSFYVSAIISHLNSLPSFLDAVRSNIAGIIDGKTNDAAFFDTCFSLLKINNFTHFLVEAADPLTKNFSDSITIQPLLPQIDQISGAVKELVSRADQLRNLIANKTVTAPDVTSFNDTINSFINIIPQYTQAYTCLLEQLRNEFKGLYYVEKTKKEKEIKESDRRIMENAFDEFIQKIAKYVIRFQNVILLASELLAQKPFPGVCDDLLNKLKNVVDNFNIMIYNYSKMMHFRGDNFEQYKTEVLNAQKNVFVIFPEIKTQFINLLSSDTPPAFQAYMNNGIHSNLDEIIGFNSTELTTDFENISKMILKDSRAVVFSPVLVSSIQTNQLGLLSLKAIQILHSISSNLRCDMLNFQEIKDKLSELHPTIKYLLTVVYNLIHRNMTKEIDKSKTSSNKKKKTKAINFCLPPEIVILTQKKTYIENLFISFDESLGKLSPDSKMLRIIQDNCSLKAILLALAIANIETGPEIHELIHKFHQLLANFADKYFKENEAKITEIIHFFKDEENIPGNSKSQFEIIIQNLMNTMDCSKKVFNEEKDICSETEQNQKISLIKKKVAEYEKLSLILSSLQYIDESYFPDNCYHETICNLQQNMTNIVKCFQNAEQVHSYQRFMCLSKIFNHVLKLIGNILPHSSKESNYSNIISVDLNRNASNMTKLNTCGIGFDPESYKFLKSEIEQLLTFIKDEKEFYQTKVESTFFKTNLEKSFQTLDNFYQEAKKSTSFLEICEVNYNVPQRDCVGPILKHFTLLINYTFDKYALALINNLPTVVQLAMNLNDLLRELDKALRYIPQPKVDDVSALLSVSELEKIQSKFESPGKILFQLTSEIPLLIDYFNDDKTSLNIALHSKKEIITEAIKNVMNYLKKIVTFTKSEISKFEENEISRQKTEYELLVEQSQKEYQQFRKEQLEKGKKIDEIRKEVREKERIEREQIEREKKEQEEREKKEQEEKERLEEQHKLLYKEPNSVNINPIFGMGLYFKCGYNPDSIELDPNSSTDMDITIDVESLSDFSNLPDINTSVFSNAEMERNKDESKENKNMDLISDLQKQLMPPDYLLTAIECGLLKERQDNNNDDMMNAEEDDDNFELPKGLNDGGDEEDNNSGEFDSENDPILGNRNLVEDDDEFFESCSDDDDEEEEESKGFFPWG